jgi:hypothetical protein
MDCRVKPGNDEKEALIDAAVAIRNTPFDVI